MPSTTRQPIKDAAPPQETVEPDEEETEDPGEQRDPALIAQARGGEATEGKLTVEVGTYVTVGNQTFGPTAEGETVEVPDTAESRAALAAGFLRLP